jgi:glycosyltransferase involved in cell wall biosynthesis
MTKRVETPLIVGNPFSPTGRGSTALRFLRAFKAAQYPIPIKDIYSYGYTIDQNIVKEIESSLINSLSNSVNIYHINLDEIEPALAALNNKLPDGAYNIIYPFWELSKMPAMWIDNLKLFDEVWAPSKFILSTIKGTVSMPIYHMPLPVEVQLDSFFGRQYFGLPYGSYVFLLFFDFRSYIHRKNPQALIDIFEKVCSARPTYDMRVVIKVHGEDASLQAMKDFQDFVSQIHTSRYKNKIIIINKLFTENEIRNLLRCSDCFVSLHRSEGFGLGMAEAMYLGKPVIATAYSGNLDFMSNETGFPVDYALIPVELGQYPYHEDNVWADPNKDQAADYMLQLIDDPIRGERLGSRASQHIRTHFSHLALGLRYKQRLQQIYQSLP